MSHELSQPGAWLTARRLRAHAFIVALCLWSAYAWNLATPGLRDRAGNLIGTDFLHFYTLGILAHDHRGADLYDMSAQALLAAQRVPEAAGIGYLPLYPPQVSIWFAPLSTLSYEWALIVWWTVCAGIYACCCFVTWRSCANLRAYGGTVLVAAIGFPAFFHLIAWGQTSAVALACFATTYFLLRARREFLAGLALGCLAFKPQLGIAAAGVFLIAGEWLVLAGAAVSARAQLGLGAMYYGTAPLHQWWDRILHANAVTALLEPKLYQTYSLRTFWEMIVPGWPGTALYIASSILVLMAAVVIWKRISLPLGVRFSALLFATMLVAPHLTVYDLVILAPAFLLLADFLAGQSRGPVRGWLGVALYFAYMLPLVGPLARWTHVQPGVIAMACCVWLIAEMRADVPAALSG